LVEIDRFGEKSHDNHRQEQDEQQGPGQLGDDDRDERILA
jgi:hypothetical protein